MSGQLPSCDQRIAQALSARERDFTGIWRRIAGDDERAALFRALDPLGIEGEPAITVQLTSTADRQWLNIQLSGTAPHGIEWVTYHCADVAEHAECLVTETRTPALRLAATYYADLAAHQLRGRDQEGR